MAGLVEGAVAVVTGAASGIGRETALRLAQEGAAAVVVADLLDEPREGGVATHALIPERTGAAATFVACDVTRVADLQAAVAAADAFGGLTVMVNAAGIFRRHDALEVTETEYDEMMDVNAKAVFFGAQAAARRMARGGGGSIVNVSSVAGLRGSQVSAVYSASKGAVRLLTYALADAFGAHGIRVNAVHPGLIETQMTEVDVPVAKEGYPVPLGRLGRPRDVADAIVYLASDLSGFVSGASLLIDGGVSRGM